MEELVNGLSPEDTTVFSHNRIGLIHRVPVDSPNRISKNRYRPQRPDRPKGASCVSFTQVETSTGTRDHWYLTACPSASWQFLTESVIRLADVDDDGLISFEEFARSDSWFYEISLEF